MGMAIVSSRVCFLFKHLELLRVFQKQDKEQPLDEPCTVHVTVSSGCGNCELEELAPGKYRGVAGAQRAHSDRICRAAFAALRCALVAREMSDLCTLCGTHRHSQCQAKL